MCAHRAAPPPLRRAQRAPMQLSGARGSWQNRPVLRVRAVRKITTGFMRHILLRCFCWFACAPRRSRPTLSLIGVIGGKAAVLALDGGEPKTVKVGQTLERDHGAVGGQGQRPLEIEGKQPRAAAAASTTARAAPASITPRSRSPPTPARPLRRRGRDQRPADPLPGRHRRDVDRVAGDASRSALGIDFRQGERGPVQHRERPGDRSTA